MPHQVVIPHGIVDLGSQDETARVGSLERQGKKRTTMKVVSNNRGKDREKGKGQGKGERTGERTGASGCTHRDHSRSSEQGDKGDSQHASSAWSLHYHALLSPLFDTDSGGGGGGG